MCKEADVTGVVPLQKGRRDAEEAIRGTREPFCSTFRLEDHNSLFSVCFVTKKVAERKGYWQSVLLWQW